jgi:protein-tyrosine phosphatase
VRGERFVSRGFVDLHLHFVPAVDDGVRTLEDAMTVCKGLRELGYDTLVSTPHIRAGMFDNTRAGLEAAFASFAQEAHKHADMPEIALSAEHHCDTNFLQMLTRGELLPYPGAHALLVEFPNEVIPAGFEQITFKLGLRGLRPVIAHPERYSPLWKRTDPVDRFLDQDVGLQLDLLSLVGKYGRAPCKAAERMLEEGAYLIAASDTHHPDDLPRVAKAMERLFELVGDQEAQVLLGENPRRLLAGLPTM